MKSGHQIVSSLCRFAVFMAGFFFLILNSFIVNAQNAQSVKFVQGLSFGELMPYGNGGTITVFPDYHVSISSEIILKSIPTPAIFEFNIEAGKTIRINYNNIIKLLGDHGGTITLTLNDSSSTGDRLIVSGPSPTRIYFGGTMTIGPPLVTPPGNYSGTLQVDFIVTNL